MLMHGRYIARMSVTAFVVNVNNSSHSFVWFWLKFAFTLFSKPFSCVVHYLRWLSLRQCMILQKSIQASCGLNADNRIISKLSWAYKWKLITLHIEKFSFMIECIQNLWLVFIKTHGRKWNLMACCSSLDQWVKSCFFFFWWLEEKQAVLMKVK